VECIVNLQNNRDTSLLSQLGNAILFDVSLGYPLPCLLIPLYSSDLLPSLVKYP